VGVRNVHVWVRVVGAVALLALSGFIWLAASSRYTEGTAARFVEPETNSNFALAPGGVDGESVRTCYLNVVDTYDPNVGITRVNLQFNFQVTGAAAGARDIGLFVNGGLLPRDDFALHVSGQTDEETAFRRTPVTLSGRYEAEGDHVVAGEILHLNALPDGGFNFTSPYLSGEIRRHTDDDHVDNVLLHVELEAMRSAFAVRHGPRLTMALPKFLGVVGDNGMHGTTSDCGNSYFSQPPVDYGTVAGLKLVAVGARSLMTRTTSVGSPYAIDGTKDPTLNPKYRLDLAVPETERGSVLSWRGPDAQNPEVSIVSRDGEVESADSLFFAGIGFTAAVAFAIFAVQMFPWGDVLAGGGARLARRRATRR
jgi:hypothetical protein